MELHQLRYFVTAARTGHFGRAAEAIPISQPSLSQGIARLERELGLQLFDRGGRGATLTAAGRELLPLAEQVVSGAARIESAAEEIRGLGMGRLEICALPALDQHLLPPWLVQFRQQFPRVELRVRELRPAGAVAQAVLSGQADLGFAHMPCELPGLRVRMLLTDPLLLIAPSGHPLASRPVVDLRDAAGEDFIWVRDANDFEHPLMRACRLSGFEPGIVCESGSAQGALALVEAGLGITLLPALAAEPRPGLTAAPLSDDSLARQLVVIWREKGASPAARAFVRLCAPLDDHSPQETPPKRA